MLTPIVAELPQGLEPVIADPFIDDAPASTRPADAARQGASAPGEAGGPRTGAGTACAQPR